MMTPRSQPTAFGPALLTVGHAGALFGPLDGIPTTLSPGGWSPLALGSELLAWWTADRPDLMTLSGAQVTSWRDVKNGYNLVQAASSLRPVYSETGYNGAPALTFDGVDDYMFMASQPFQTGSAGGEVWVNADQLAIPTDTLARVIVQFGGSGANNRRTLRRAVASGVNRAEGITGTGSALVSIVDANADLTGRNVTRFIVTSTGSSVSSNGGSSASVSVVPATNADGGVAIGANLSGSANHNGKIRDVVITAALSTDVAAKLTSFLLERRVL